MSESTNNKCQNLWYVAKVVLKGKFRISDAYVTKIDLKLIHLNFFVKTLKEEEYNQSKEQKGNTDEK